MSGEHRLIANVLIEAIFDALAVPSRFGGRTVAKNDFLSARSWIFSEKNSHKRPFGFEWICRELDRDEEEIRKFIREIENLNQGERNKALAVRMTSFRKVLASVPSQNRTKFKY